MEALRPISVLVSCTRFKGLTRAVSRKLRLNDNNYANSFQLYFRKKPVGHSPGERGCHGWANPGLPSEQKSGTKEDTPWTFEKQDSDEGRSAPPLFK